MLCSFFLNVLSKGLGVLKCQTFPTADPEVDALMMASNPSVSCDPDADGGTYFWIRFYGLFIVLIFGVVLSFMHWHPFGYGELIEWVGLVNSSLVAAICIFFSAEEEAEIALFLLSGVAVFFAVLARIWAEKFENDGDDSNDAEEHAYRVMEFGSYAELVTYVLGLGLVFGDKEDSPVPFLASCDDDFPDDSCLFSELSGLAILVVMTVFAVWTFGIGVADELAARKAEKLAVAHILFNNMDADLSGTLDYVEIKELCKMLGKEYSDDEFKKAMAELDVNGDQNVDADEFCQWWVEVGGKKIPLPEDLEELASHAGNEIAMRGCPFHKSEDFHIDDRVRWFKQDDDIPKGSIGVVVGFKHERKAGNLLHLEENDETGVIENPQHARVYVAWPNAKYFAMEARELLIYDSPWRKRAAPEAQEAAAVAQKAWDEAKMLLPPDSQSDETKINTESDAQIDALEEDADPESSEVDQSNEAQDLHPLEQAALDAQTAAKAATRDAEAFDFMIGDHCTVSRQI
eukprot:SAG31_NODE_257_length_18942_cov_6.099135_13_plen_517_part_00